MGFINIYSVAKYQKTRKGDSFETLKIFEKSRQCQKNRKGDPFVWSGFLGYVNSKKRKGGTLLHSFPLTGLGLMVVVLVVSIVRKVAQSE